MATAEEIAGLSDKQRRQLAELLRTRLRRADNPITEDGETLSFPHRSILRPENLDPATTEGKINNSMILASGLTGPVAGLVAAARGGVGSLLGAGAGLVGRGAIGAGVGAAAGSVPLPFVGKLGTREGAILGGGLAIGRNPGGTGALFKHGLKVKGLKALLQRLGITGGDDAAAALAGAADDVTGLAPGASSSLGDELGSAVAGARRVRLPPAGAGSIADDVAAARTTTTLPSQPGLSSAPLNAQQQGIAEATRAARAERAMIEAAGRPPSGVAPASGPYSPTRMPPPASPSAPPMSTTSASPSSIFPREVAAARQTASSSLGSQAGLVDDAATAAPTGAIPQQVDAARRATSLPGAVDDLAAFDATAASTARAAPLRAEIGSERAARQLGMSRGQVQRDAGTILDEALGETSKIIPAKPWASIIKTMKALPPNERVAYVARAKDIKSRDQIENLRRTLEELGLLLPVGVGAGVAGLADN